MPEELTNDQNIARIVLAAIEQNFTVPGSLEEFKRLLKQHKNMGSARAEDVLKVLRGEKDKFPNAVTAHSAFTHILEDELHINLGWRWGVTHTADAYKSALSKHVPNLESRLERVNAALAPSTQALSNEDLKIRMTTRQAVMLAELIAGDPKLSKNSRVIELMQQLGIETEDRRAGRL